VNGLAIIIFESEKSHRAGTLRAIIREAELTVEEFVKLL
jgi:hypothetical protein